METHDLVERYKKDGYIQTIAEEIKKNTPQLVQLKGLVGSLGAVIASSMYELHKQHHVFVLSDREEAAYFHNDLQSLLPDKEVFFFPTSYKRAYQYEETENANVLQRAEVLNKINDEARNASEGELIVTYPEALGEKVINKRSLLENTFIIKVGDSFSLDFLMEFLTEYNFDRTDFVYEAGQFAIRGGIIDVFSFANELPYRIELFGDEIESIRTFEPVSQLSKEKRQQVSIIPNVQNRLFQEVRESFLKFIPKNTKIWVKNQQEIFYAVKTIFQQVSESFAQIVEQSQVQIISKPETIFDSEAEFKENFRNFTCVEFGKTFSKKKEAIVFEFEAKAQELFAKDFNLFGQHILDKNKQNIDVIIAVELPKQIERLQTIFEEINPAIHFEPLNVSLHEGFFDKNMGLCCYTDHQFFERFHRYRTKERYSKAKALTLKELKNLQVGDFVTHIDYGIGRFAGMEKVENNGKIQEAIRLIYKDDDMLLVSIHSLHKIAKYTGKEGTAPILHKIGSGEWEQKKKNVKRKVKDIAAELIKLYAKRKAAPGFAFSKDSYLQVELESSFLYEDTPDQAKATQAVKEDMEQAHPMDRLVCGDVGFGKTEIAIRAAFKAVADSKQVAVLVPTTILAMQHYKTFSERLKGLPCNVEYINRFKSTKEINETLKNLKEGKIDILIGTHRLTSQDVKFRNLGLLVIDEEQKFGVKTKEKLKELSVNIDVLTLTATPIPRTLHFSLLGARDLSIIATPPPNRQPVTTEIHHFNEAIFRDAISYEIRRGGQVFVVHNRISDIEQIANIILRLVPDAKVGYAHGQMEGKLLEKIMLKFIDGEYDVLVSTNIIESGLDIPNANTIIINQAHLFGLSDLHQMRGRVGRSNRKAFCYLLVPAMDGLPADSRKRLQALEEFSDLGDGFRVAMRDLDIRGAGNLLGGEQSGFINDLGYEAYHQILEDAVKELKEDEFKELFMNEFAKEVKKEFRVDCNVETDLEIMIPEYYVSNISERLQLYSKADRLKNEEELDKFKNSLQDRFGELPAQVEDLLKMVQLRWLAEKIGFEKLLLKNQTLKGYFVPSQGNETYFQSDIFGKILQFVQDRNHKVKRKEAQKRLIFVMDGVKTVEGAIRVLNKVLG